MVNKFTKSLLVAIAALFSYAFAFAETGTETNPTSSTKNAQLDCQSFYIAGDFIPSGSGKQYGTMANSGLKLRTNQVGNTLTFTVNAPYTIKKLELDGYANDAGIDATLPGIKVSKAEVDGVEATFTGGEFPVSGASTSAKFTLENISAGQTITLTFDNSNVTKTSQIVVSWTVEWERPDATQPTITVSPKAVSLVPTGTYKLTAKVDPTSFTTKWVSDNEAVATVAEDGTVTAVAAGTANISNQWADDATVADAAVITVADFNTADYTVTKEYDFKAMADVTLAIASEAAGAIWNEANKKPNNVFFCTNEGLENIALQAVAEATDKKGWILTENGLFLASGAGRCAAVGNLLADQVVEVIYTGAGFYTGSKEDAVRKDDGATKTALNEGVGRAIYKMNEDGLFGFELIAGNAVEKIIVYEKSQAPAETIATFNFADPNFREKIGTAMADVDGFIYNETFTAEGATLQITGGSAPSRIYVDNNRGQNLVTYKEYTTLTFKAPEGKAITKIEFTAAGNSNIKNFTASSGTIEDMTWTGNADGVRFTQGGTSYLANAIVTLVDKDAETAALPAIEYTECENIAAFNALEAGTYAKVKLTDAEVIGVSADGYSTAWVQDATGGCWVQYTSLNAGMKEKTKGNGFVYCVKRFTSGNPQMKEAEDTPKSEIAGAAIDDYTVVEGSTIAEVNVAANLNKVVKLTGASFVATSATAGTLTLGEESIDVSNGTATANQQLHKIDATWVKEETKMNNVTIVAILVAKSATANQLLPITMIEEEVVGISNVNVAEKNVGIFNLQGVRQNKLQKGVNIVNGTKIVVK